MSLIGIEPMLTSYHVCAELPIPSLKSLQKKQNLKPEPQQQQLPPATPTGPPQANSGAAQTGAVRSAGWDSDPWNSPDLHKGHHHAAAAQNGTSSYTNGTNGAAAAAAAIPQRTTSTFTTHSEQPDSSSSTAFEPSIRPSTSESGWGGYSGAAEDGFNPAPGEEESGQGGFGAPGGGGSEELAKALRTNKTIGGVEELVTVNVLEEKEGMFLFQHRNYEVASIRRGSKVIRRYSDFVWLLDCLHKRYPFRQLPLLPPKRVASECSTVYAMLQEMMLTISQSTANT